ncbi:prophage CP4-57 regulatory protein [Geobacter sp. OR-1]|nr:prophage CP4-57 regulatory protein [Geobacter sp. OR-1]
MILRRKVVRERTGLSDSAIYRLEQVGQFPSRRKLTAGGRVVGWDAAEVEEWCKTRSAVQLPPKDISKIGSGKPGPGRPRK